MAPEPEPANSDVLLQNLMRKYSAPPQNTSEGDVKKLLESKSVAHELSVNQILDKYRF